MNNARQSESQKKKYLTKRHTSLEFTFKHARNAGFSNFCSNTPREGKPRIQAKGVLLGQSQINCMTKVHARFALQKSIRYQYVKRKAKQWLI
jgi:hypothetical protein